MALSRARRCSVSAIHGGSPLCKPGRLPRPDSVDAAGIVLTHAAIKNTAATDPETAHIPRFMRPSLQILFSEIKTAWVGYRKSRHREYFRLVIRNNV